MASGFETLEARVQAAGYRACSNCTVVAGGDPFRAIFAHPDHLLDVVTVGAQGLRYPTSQGLADGQSLTVDGAVYRVATPPRRLGSGLESIVELVPA